MSKTTIHRDMHYLELLSTSFPTIASAATEIINLEAIMNLPKGTEHFLADLHGESQAFQHVLKNASGNIRRKVSELFRGDIRESERRELCTLIYYPEEKIQLIKESEPDIDDWYHITILNRTSRRFHRGCLQRHTTSFHRPIAHLGRYIRSWSWCSYHS